MDTTFCLLHLKREYWKNTFHPRILKEMDIEIPIFNGDVGPDGLYAIASLNFKFTEHGSVAKTIHFETFHLGHAHVSWKKNTVRMTFEVVSFVLGIYLFVLSARAVWKLGFSSHRTFSVCCYSLFLALVSLWLYIYLEHLEPVLADILEGDPLSPLKCGTTGYSCGYRESLDLVAQILWYAKLNWMYEYLAMCFSVFALIECFCILSFHRRLSILTVTLLEAASDIFHWGVVVGILTVVFATVFHYHFGPKIGEFSTWGSSFGTLLLMVVGLYSVDTGSLDSIEWILLMLYGASIAILMVNLR